MAPEKQDGPTSVITFLAIINVTVRQELRLPPEKLHRLLDAVSHWKARKSITKSELQSLLGVLQHACRVIIPGKTFLRRAISLLSVASSKFHHIRLSAEFKSDMMWWKTFAPHWNGAALIVQAHSPSFTITSDASGSWGCSAWHKTHWFQLAWDELTHTWGTAPKELAPILVAAVLWGHSWRGGRVLAQCDNAAVVSVLNSRYCQDKRLMQLLHCLFFIEAYFQFKLIAAHLPGIHNELADDLSRNRLPAFLAKFPDADTVPSLIPPSLLVVAISSGTGLDVSSLDSTVQFFSSRGVAPSTNKTYQSALRRFYSFCSSFTVPSPFPVSEAILCYFASYLAAQQLSPQTIKTYLAGIRFMQITLGLPEPRAFSSLPRLRLVQAGIQRVYAEQGKQAAKIRLPITPSILRKMHGHWNTQASDPDVRMLWAASVLCFFGFLRSREITRPSLPSYRASHHLSWGDVAIDNPTVPEILRVRIKRSKTDQLGKGVDVCVGRTGCSICPVAAVLSYMATRGNKEGAFFHFHNGQPLTKAQFTQLVRLVLQAVGLPYEDFSGHSFRIGAATAAAKAGIKDSTISTLGHWSSSCIFAFPGNSWLDFHSHLLYHKVT